MAEIKEIERLERRLIDGGWLSSVEFGRIRESLSRYEAARARNPLLPRLGVGAFVEATRPRLSFVAWAAVREIPFEKAEDIVAAAEPTFGAEFFAFKRLPNEVPQGLQVGETLVRMGILTSEQLQQTLDLQKVVEENSGVRLLVGILLLRHNLIDMGAYFQALALHFGVEASRIDDDLLGRIEDAWAQRRASKQTAGDT